MDFFYKKIHEVKYMLNIILNDKKKKFKLKLSSYASKFARPALNGCIRKFQSMQGYFFAEIQSMLVGAHSLAKRY